MRREAPTPFQPHKSQRGTKLTVQSTFSFSCLMAVISPIQPIIALDLVVAQNCVTYKLAMSLTRCQIHWLWSLDQSKTRWQNREQGNWSKANGLNIVSLTLVAQTQLNQQAQLKSPIATRPQWQPRLLSARLDHNKSSDNATTGLPSACHVHADAASDACERSALSCRGPGIRLWSRRRLLCSRRRRDSHRVAGNGDWRARNVHR